MEPDDDLEDVEMEEMLRNMEDTSDGLFCIEDEDDDDDNDNSSDTGPIGKDILHDSSHKEEDLDGSSSSYADINKKGKRVGVSAVAGGVTGALLSVPLVAVDVTVLAVAGPIVAVAAAGGAAFVAATTTGSPKEMVQEQLRRAREEIHNRTAASSVEEVVHFELEKAPEEETKQEEEKEADENEDVDPLLQTKKPITWVPDVFQRRASFQKHKQQQGEEVATLVSDLNTTSSDVIATKKKPLASGLSGCGMMWVMSQKGGCLCMEGAWQADSQSHESDLPQDQEEKEADAPAARRPMFQWANLRRKTANQEPSPQTPPTKTVSDRDGDDDNATAVTAPDNEVVTTSDHTEASKTPRSWMPPMFGRRAATVERDDTEEEEEEEEEDYFSDESEEEVVFGMGQDDTSRAALFADDDNNSNLFQGPHVVA